MFYSRRNTTKGSSLVARSAGTATASPAASASAPTAPSSETGSVGESWNSIDASARAYLKALNKAYAERQTNTPEQSEVVKQ